MQINLTKELRLEAECKEMGANKTIKGIITSKGMVTAADLYLKEIRKTVTEPVREI